MLPLESSLFSAQLTTVTITIELLTSVSSRDRHPLSLQVYLPTEPQLSHTIADLEASGEIHEEHISEAVQYRSLDRRLWLK